MTFAQKSGILTGNMEIQKIKIIINATKKTHSDKRDAYDCLISSDGEVTIEALMNILEQGLIVTAKMMTDHHKNHDCSEFSKGQTNFAISHPMTEKQKRRMASRMRSRLERKKNVSMWDSEKWNARKRSIFLRLHPDIVSTGSGFVRKIFN